MVELRKEILNGTPSRFYDERNVVEQMESLKQVNKRCKVTMDYLVLNENLIDQEL